jgi:hypothetical protein
MRIRFVRDCKVGNLEYKKDEVIEISFQEAKTLRRLAPGVFIVIADGIGKHLSHPPLDRMMRQQVTK